MFLHYMLLIVCLIDYYQEILEWLLFYVVNSVISKT